jgi:hypothetical protein
MHLRTPSDDHRRVGTTIPIVRAEHDDVAGIAPSGVDRAIVGHR